MKLILMVAFSGILGTSWVEDQRMIKDKLIDEKILWIGLEMIRDAGSDADDYLISPKLRQILLPWRCELKEEDFFNELSN